MKKFIVLLLSILLSSNISDAKMLNGTWHNDLRTLFLSNQAIIYTINLRTFNAKDTNKNEIIDGSEERGNFLNAIDRLNEIKTSGVNTLHVLPITSVGKLKAFGTAGSLYAVEDFGTLNPQLCDKNSSLSIKNQAKTFISECHKRNIRVILDMPSCGSYDMFVKHPEYFVEDEKGQPIIPLDWNDVRILKVGDDTKLNEDVYNEHKRFIDMALELGADGIRADVATMRSACFWKNLIDYTRSKDSEFMFLAEASNAWTTPPSKHAPFTTYDKLLEVGFDGYYGDFFNLKNWKTSDELINAVQFIQKFPDKAVIGSFTTHDEVSPILLKGADFSKMIIWLNTTLPLNSYYVDGFSTGDDYDYPWVNAKASVTYTDDVYYFNHKGQLDIFNFSRRPGGMDISIYDEFIMANKFKQYYANTLSNMKFVPLKTNSKNVFAYARKSGNEAIVTIGNLDYDNFADVVVKMRGISPKCKVINLRITRNVKPVVASGKIVTSLKPGDILVFMIKGIN